MTPMVRSPGPNVFSDHCFWWRRCVTRQKSVTVLFMAYAPLRFFPPPHSLVLDAHLLPELRAERVALIAVRSLSFHPLRGACFDEQPDLNAVLFRYRMPASPCLALFCCPVER